MNFNFSNELVKVSFVIWAILIICVGCCVNIGEKPEQINMSEITPNTNTSLQQLDQFVLHYWDRFDFNDTTYLGLPDITEQAFVDYINLFPRITLPVVEKSIESMLDKAINGDSKMLGSILSLYEKYLYDPNSPFRNEDYYLCFLNCIIDSDGLDEVMKIRPRFQLEMVMKNRPGDIACDFEIYLKDGESIRLFDLQNEYSILFFNNPGCQECNRVKELLLPFSRPNIDVISVFVDDDLDLWYKTKYPSNWINGYNRSIRMEKTYHLPAMPTLFLLDEDKRVILKDVSVEQIMAYVEKENHTNQ